MKLKTSKANAQFNTLNMLASEQLMYRASTLRSAALQVVALPFLAAVVMWVSGESLLRIALLGEVVLLGFLACVELRKMRETSRRNAIALAGINTLFLIIYALFISNLMLMVFTGAGFGALLIMVAAKQERIHARKCSWFLLCVVFVGSCLALQHTRQSLEKAREAYRAETFDEAYESLEGVAPFLSFRGGSREDAVLIEFRRAELAYREGRLVEAQAQLQRVDALARQLTMPPIEEIGAENYRRELAYVLVNDAIPELYAAIYARQAWGVDRYPKHDPLAAVAFDSARGVSWGW